jgi:hypothetical protein
MKHIFIIFFLSIFTASCEDFDIATVVIENNSNYELSNCKVYAYFGDTILQDSINFGSVLKNEKLTKTWKTKLPSSDGAFYFRCFQNNHVFDKTFGYFTNGGLLDKQYIITVTDDDVTVSTK